MLLATVFDAVVMVADGCSLIETAERVKPALLMVDLLLAKKNIADLISRLREVSPGSRVIVVSVHDEPSVAQAVIEAGADGFLVKCHLGILGVSVRTVEFHKYEMMQSLGIQNSAELIHFAIKHGIVQI